MYWQADKALEMNLKVKHSILFLFSLALLIATLFVPREADNLAQMKPVKLGYPVTFINQDFSFDDASFSYFPNWHRFKPFMKEYPYKIVWPRFVVSLLITFLLVEGLIYILETADFKIRQKFATSE